MHKRLTVVLLSLIVGLTACNRQKSLEPMKSEYTANEYDVISAYVDGVLANATGKRQIGKIVIFNMTSSGDADLLPDEKGRAATWEKTAESLREKAPSLQQTTIDGFRRANVRQALLGRGFHFPVEYEIVDSAQLESVFKRNGGDWPEFYNRHPGSQGVATLSQVGFNANATQALFYVSNRCGGLCGRGLYVVMEKRNGRWLTSNEIEMWVS